MLPKLTKWLRGLWLRIAYRRHAWLSARFAALYLRNANSDDDLWLKRVNDARANHAKAAHTARKAFEAL